MKLTSLSAPCAALLLSACALPYSPPVAPKYEPYSGPVAAPQVVYRIDEHRYFELVPYENKSCTRAWFYYTDTSKGIHTRITKSNGLRRVDKFIIDAANDQYLVALIKGSNADCGADSSANSACSDRLPYSVDAGRTWKYSAPRLTNNTPIVLTGDAVFYATQRAKLSELAQGIDSWVRIGDTLYSQIKQWDDDGFPVLPDDYVQRYALYQLHEITRNKIIAGVKRDLKKLRDRGAPVITDPNPPPIRKMPIDTKFHCVRNEEE